MIAHYIESQLFSIADYSLDLHSGGSSLHYVPSVVATLGENKERMRKTKELMKALQHHIPSFSTWNMQMARQIMQLRGKMLF